MRLFNFANLGLGITAEQFVLLDAIFHNPGISQKDLATVTLKNLSNITRILNILERDKLIYREVGKNKNYLIKTLFLTEKGKQVMAKNREKIVQDYENLFSNFSEDEIETRFTSGRKLNTGLLSDLCTSCLLHFLAYGFLLKKPMRIYIIWLRK